MAALYNDDSLNLYLYDMNAVTATPTHRIIPRSDTACLPTPDSASCAQLFAVTNNSPEYCYYEPSVDYLNSTPATSSSSICDSPVSSIPLMENLWQDQLIQEPTTPEELLYLDTPPELDAENCNSGTSSVTDSRSISPQLLEDPYIYIQTPSQQPELAPAPQLYSVYQPLPSPAGEFSLQPHHPHHYYSIPQHQAASLALSLACGTAFSKRKATHRSTCTSPASAANGAGISKPHECKHCHKTFKRLEHLKRHLKIHTDERPYQCDVHQCGRRFSRSDNLRAHRRTHMKKGGRNLFIEGLQADANISSSTA